MFLTSTGILLEATQKKCLTMWQSILLQTKILSRVRIYIFVKFKNLIAKTSFLKQSL